MTDQPTGGTSEHPEEAAPTPPPPPAQSSAPTPPPAGGTSYDSAAAKAALQGANKLDLGIIAAGVVAWLAGFMPFYTASVSAGGFSQSASASAYHGFFGWFALWVALATAVVVALSLFNVVRLPMAVHQIAVAGFGLSLLCLVLALFIFPGGGCPDTGGLGGLSCDTGHGFGYWLALLVVLAGTVLSVLRMRESTTSTTTA
jgi:hypothetical protein